MGTPGECCSQWWQLLPSCTSSWWSSSRQPGLSVAEFHIVVPHCWVPVPGWCIVWSRVIVVTHWRMSIADKRMCVSQIIIFWRMCSVKWNQLFALLFRYTTPFWVNWNFISVPFPYRHLWVSLFVRIRIRPRLLSIAASGVRKFTITFPILISRIRFLS